jgi:tRNA-binding protein
MSVPYTEFQKLSIRVGKIAAANKIPGKDKIITVDVDIGGKTLRAIAGGAQFYTPEGMVGKTVVVITNLESRVIAGVKSEAMLLAADAGGKPIWLTVEEDVPAGTIVR